MSNNEEENEMSCLVTKCARNIWSFWPVCLKTKCFNARTFAGKADAYKNWKNPILKIHRRVKIQHKYKNNSQCIYMVQCLNFKICILWSNVSQKSQMDKQSREIKIAQKLTGVGVTFSLILQQTLTLYYIFSFLSYWILCHLISFVEISRMWPAWKWK